MSGIHLAICGATGAVGREMIKTVEQRNIPVDRIRLFASARSKGKTLTFKGKEVEVEELTETSFDGQGIDYALFSCGGGNSTKFAPCAGRNNTIVIDNSSAWRMDPEVPLVVPEVNPEAAKNHPKNIIANPNCSTIQMVVALKPIHDAAGIKRVVVATYQSASGAGNKGISELEQQVEALKSGDKLETAVHKHQLAFDCVPHIGSFLDNGYTDEEMKLQNETQKIMGDSSINVSMICVRVPVRISHSEAVFLELNKKLTADEAREILSKAPGIKVIDDPANKEYPLATKAEGHDETFVGRIREDISLENGLNMWVVSDNLRKGAALNAVQILELFL